MHCGARSHSHDERSGKQFRFVPASTDAGAFTSRERKNQVPSLPGAVPTPEYLSVGAPPVRPNAARAIAPMRTTTSHLTRRCEHPGIGIEIEVLFRLGSEAEGAVLAARLGNDSALRPPLASTKVTSVSRSRCSL